jgi:hypothetical protein
MDGLQEKNPQNFNFLRIDSSERFDVYLSNSGVVITMPVPSSTYGTKPKVQAAFLL